MLSSPIISLLGICCILAGLSSAASSPWQNPILPGFHPDPSCIHVDVPSFNDTFFCASSSFNAFPGIPVHASKDLQQWRLIGNVLSRPDQLPNLSDATGGTSGIWAPALRFHNGTFYLFTTLVFDQKPQDDESRWDNVFFTTQNPFDPDAWSDPTHFKFVGYDVSPFWGMDGTVYVHGAHTWQLGPHVDQIILDLETGSATNQVTLWDGTGGLAPEGPHIYFRDEWYYLLIAEGGTGLGHIVTMARSKNISGPFEPAPNNPVLTNANTTEYFQTVGHADIFQDSRGDWWAVALSTRSGPQFISYPMGRETVLTNVSWPAGQDWPVFQPVRADIGGEPLPDLLVDGIGELVDANDNITFGLGPNETSVLPPHFVHWRVPDPSAYTISAPESNHTSTLRLTASLLNLTGFDSNGAAIPGTNETGRQTFVGRRQVHTMFRFGVTLAWEEDAGTGVGVEKGVSVFLTQNHHIDFAILPSSSNSTADTTTLRIHTITSLHRPDTLLTLPLPAGPRSIRLGIEGVNMTHYAFTYTFPGSQEEEVVAGYALTQDVSWGFDGAMLGVYATTNGAPVSEDEESYVYVSEWTYEGMGQVRA